MKIARRRAFVIAGLVLISSIAGTFWYLRGRNSPPIPPRGGEAFSGLATLETPFFQQKDARWKDDTIGGSGESLGKVGCTIASLAMALHVYGFRTTPKELNDWLKANDGYTFRGWLKWEAVNRYTRGTVAVAIPDRPTHADIDAALRARQPVLAKVFINRIIPHWVLIAGKQGNEYLVRDPLNATGELEPLSRYGSPIYGVRVVHQ
jgi:hypothetical protein